MPLAPAEPPPCRAGHVALTVGRHVSRPWCRQRCTGLDTRAYGALLDQRGAAYGALLDQRDAAYGALLDQRDAAYGALLDQRGATYGALLDQRKGAPAAELDQRRREAAQLWASSSATRKASSRDCMWLSLGSQSDS
ncbi:hypothetical protein GCM10027568_06170 [Humibacter soli]